MTALRRTGRKGKDVSFRNRLHGITSRDAMILEVKAERVVNMNERSVGILTALK